MEGTKLQAKVYAGQGKAASRIGLPFDVYRPASATSVLDVANKVATALPAHFTVSGNYTTPNSYGKATWQGMLDGSQTQVGDYLVGAPGTFFIAAQQPLLPILAVSCTRTVSVTQGGTEPVAVGWPASILIQSTRGGLNTEEIVGRKVNPYWWVLMPAVVGVSPNRDDLLTDDLMRNYIIDAAEMTDLGWRLSVTQTTTITDSVVNHYATVIGLIGKSITYRSVTALTGANGATNPVNGPITVATTGIAGDTTIALTAPAGNWFLAPGDTFNIEGDLTTYEVTALAASTAGKFTADISPCLVQGATAGTAVAFTWLSDYPVKALISDYPSSLIAAGTVQITDLHLKVGKVATDGRTLPSPSTLDKIVIDGKQRSIVTVKPEYAGDQIAVYDIQSRG